MALPVYVLDWVTFFKVCNIDRGWVEEDMERRQRRKIMDGWKRWGRGEMEIFFFRERPRRNFLMWDSSYGL